MRCPEHGTRCRGHGCCCADKHLVDGIPERFFAWLAYKLGKRPSDSLLEYCAEWASTPALRREATRLLTKRRSQQVSARKRSAFR